MFFDADYSCRFCLIESQPIVITEPVVHFGDNFVDNFFEFFPVQLQTHSCTSDGHTLYARKILDGFRNVFRRIHAPSAFAKSFR